MGARNTKESFIQKAQTKHGERYDYSRVVYINNKTSVEIICPEHGVFYQRPDSHLVGKGCPFCGLDKQKSLLYGVGVNDLYLTQTVGKNSPLYLSWKGMLERCYKNGGIRGYEDCSVCEQWHKLSNYREFFDENYIEGFAIDKDFLIPGNKVYRPEACIFIPTEINSLLIKCGRDENGKLRGVNYSERLGKYVANVSFSAIGKRIHIGVYDTEAEAERAYISKKREIIKQIADKYRDKMPELTYLAIINHQFS